MRSRYGALGGRFVLGYSRREVFAVDQARASGRGVVHGPGGRGFPSGRERPELTLQRLIGNRATAALLSRAAVGERVLARTPPSEADQRADQAARGDRVHDDAMEFLENKLRQLYSMLPDAERAEFRASGGDQTIAIGMVTDPGDRSGKRPRLVYTTAGNRASKSLQAAADKLGLTRWVVDANVKKKVPPPAKGEPPKPAAPPVVHGPHEGPPPGIGGVEHAEQLIVLGAENESVVLEALAVSRRLCADCPTELRNYREGRITLSVVLDDDAPAVPNPREERWRRKQGGGAGPRGRRDDDERNLAGRGTTKRKDNNLRAGGARGGDDARRGGGGQPSGETEPGPEPATTPPSTSEPATPAPPAVKAPAPATATPATPDPAEVEARQARAAADELIGFEAGTKNLEFMIESVHLALGVWNLVGLIEQFASAGAMATSTLANGSPYWQAINGAHDTVKKAKEVDDYYNNLELRLAIPSAETDPLDWNSTYQLYQKQLEFLLIEAHIHAARESIDGAMDAIREHYKDLKDGMGERERAVMALPVTSAQYAEALLFADAGAKINPLLEEAITIYAHAASGALLQDRMAEAAMQTLEVRLRALGDSGVFHSIDTDDLKGTKLDDFNQRNV
jgi:hypothetical protein